MLNYDAIKYELEQTTCAVHHQHPEVTIKETQDNLSLACCCEDFQKICMSEIQELLAVQAQTAIMDAFNNGIKGLR